MKKRDLNKLSLFAIIIFYIGGIFFFNCTPTTYPEEFLKIDGYVNINFNGTSSFSCIKKGVYYKTKLLFSAEKNNKNVKGIVCCTITNICEIKENDAFNL